MKDRPSAQHFARRNPFSLFPLILIRGGGIHDPMSHKMSGPHVVFLEALGELISRATTQGYPYDDYKKP